MHDLYEILDEIRRRKWCDYCPLREMKFGPLILEPDREVNVMVVTEGPNRIEKPEIIASLANYPTYHYLSTLFGGKFRPLKNANAYWTHLRKCYIKDDSGRSLISSSDDKKAIKICKKYLKHEIKAVQPDLILSVGGRVLSFLRSISSKEDRKKLKGNIKDIFMKNEGIIGNVRLSNIGLEKEVKIAVVPHPSGRSTFFVDLSMEEKEKVARILEKVKSEILGAI